MKISEAEKKAVVVDTDSIPVGAANSPKAYRFTMQQVKQYANDGMATKSEMDATIGRAESAASVAQAAAMSANKNTTELLDAIKKLPDGQAVSVEVAKLKIEKADKADAATKAGVFMQLIAGLAEGIWDTNPESGNAREWLVGRPVIGCPDLVIPRMNDIDARSGQNKDIVVDKVAGGVVGGNQLQEQDYSEWLTSTMKKTVADGIITIVSKTGSSNSTQRQNYTKKGDKCMWMFAYKSTKTVSMQDMGRSSLPVANEWNNVGTIYTIQGIGQYIYNYSQLAENEWEMSIKNFTFLDLTTLFPLDQTFVNSLYSGENAAKQAEACSRVLTRLGIIALDD